MNPLEVLTPRGQTFFWLGLLVVLSGMSLGYPDVTRVGLLIAVLPVCALVLTRRRPPSLAVRRVVQPVRLQPDQRGQVEVRFVNVGTRTSVMYLAEEHLDPRLGDRPRFLLPRMDPGEERTVRYPVRSPHRGAFTLGPLGLRQRDPFGLTYVALRLSSTAEVLVLPTVHDLGDDRLRASARGSEGEQPQMVALHGEDDVSIRSYRDGDELRRVHWPATAHRGELMVRQEDRPARRRAVLLLDSRRSAHGDTPSPSFEYAVSAVASVARRLLVDGFVVHLLTPATVRDGSAAHPMGLDEMLDTLARAVPEPDVQLEAIAGAAHTFTSGGVLAVAAVVARDADQLRHLAGIREPGSRALAFVLDRKAFTDGKVHQALTRSRGSGILADAGWQTVPCTPQTPVPQAWVQLQSRASAGSLS
ncbi:DUF58 domain-containing protein [Ornithinimicrobium sediminis]|uniref:DUF58 domain-containing protein n=1 Tax=Ornithinimicrobium sediminis TaxID=2904603 RepID=UPI001E5DB361|nr:DUF58 domain-containing protein [Ornithinimicrobium sediminis]MCE0488205.1 DUF58 domain-containing protein [Ornithinimicrobium sediminis]